MIRTALIGGASKGLGFGCAEALAQKAAELLCAHGTNLISMRLHMRYVPSIQR